VQSTLSYIALKQPRLNALIEREVPSTLSHIPEEQTPSILFREREVPYTLSHITLQQSHLNSPMGWLQLVGSIKL